MKTNPRNASGSSPGYALLITVIFVGLAVVLLTTVMKWTMQTSQLTDRNNEYFATVAAAEGASEMALVRLTRDYLNGGGVTVLNNLAGYQNLYPSASDNAYWNDYAFSNPLNGNSGTYVARATNWQYAVLNGQYSGLYGYQSTYRIVANARRLNSLHANLSAAVRQDVGLQSIPIFQFAIFYNADLEMNPSPAMVVSGRVHANGNIYTRPSTSLTFASDVTASGFITNTHKPGDPLGDRGIVGPPVVVHQGKHDGHTSTLNLPIGTNGTSDNVNQILQVPPVGELANSPMGASRMYNKSDLRILISDTGVSVAGGPTSVPTAVSSNDWKDFLVTTNLIYNKREASHVRATQFDVGKFRAWAEHATNVITPLLSGKAAINAVYIADQRSSNATITTYTTNGSGVVSSTSTAVTVQPGVELINGERLPKAGLTVASPDPVYVRGDYNTTADGVNYSKGTTDTTHTLPAAIMGDALMVLSTSWSDANSSKPLADRVASDTTINAAFLGGNVPTKNDHYSGGVENFPRFLENWGNGKTLHYNGSMVVMFESTKATAPWGSNNDTYSPPVRKWSFDKNFLEEAKLPPATPQIMFIERLSWNTLKAGVVP